MENKTIDEVMICPKCNSDNVNQCNIDEVEFDIDGTGHYFVDCKCATCSNIFRLYTRFKYTITDSHT